MCLLAETNATAPACGVATAMTEEEIDNMVQLHNDYRRQEGSDEFAVVSTDITWYDYRILIVACSFVLRKGFIIGVIVVVLDACVMFVRFESVSVIEGVP